MEVQTTTKQPERERERIDGVGKGTSAAPTYAGSRPVVTVTLNLAVDHSTVLSGPASPPVHDGAPSRLGSRDATPLVTEAPILVTVRHG